MPAAQKEAIVQGEKYRFTILTDRLIRMEYEREGRFNDAVTQRVVCRTFPPVEFRVIDEPMRLEIITEQLHLYYNKREFSAEGLSVQLKGGFAVYGSNWHYGDSLKDLKGTARTLDNIDGAVELEQGLLSRDGFTVLDDSGSALLTADGEVKGREFKEEDLYFFGYGHDYLGCLKDFYTLCGKVPLLPRYALGNWWSRFYAYTEETYLKLMDRFREHQIPLSTAVIDMDWHLTELPEKYGSGWTGYTWNREYFPDPERFLKALHERSLHVTLNVHPADGVRAHEAAYRDMAKALGIDYEHEDKIPFDITDPDFTEAYFKYLHHPNEKKGVDFWWIDWQQGSGSAIAGVDTLWLLNHVHFLDSKRDGKRPM
ncbi:MAG: alpha-xylosidase, partial [Lachnospiraceae bacterium]|nr:alpha-xylosidase [Lachnospiraceae bacterium]